MRVLHIGNTANNAFLNARLQNASGLEADVLAANETYALASPEWEEAELKRAPADLSAPDWRKAAPYRRPDWFAAASTDLAILYLLSRSAGQDRSARWLRRLIQLELWLGRSTGAGQLCRSMLQFFRLPVSMRHLPGFGLLARLAKLCGARASARRFGQWQRLARSMESPSVLDRALRKAALPADADRNRMAAFTRQNWRPFTRLLLRRYDEVQYYGEMAWMGCLAGASYTAYEHGTLRETPDQPLPPLTRAAFSAAGTVFVTNADCLETARHLRPGQRVVPLPHAMDPAGIAAFAVSEARIEPVSNRVFWPGRQDWVDRHPHWSKGSDKFIDAIALLREEGVDIRVSAIAWGRDLDASRQRIEALGCSDLFEWRAPLNKRAMYREALRCVGTADQFAADALGALPVEIMALGRPVATRISARTGAEFFGEAPPVCSASSPDDIAACLKTWVHDPAAAARAGLALQDWALKYHSAARIFSIQAAEYGFRSPT
jgi:glycosyltransferase involved in cell wall biosynthesis